MKLLRRHLPFGFLPFQAAVICWATVVVLPVIVKGQSPDKDEFKLTTSDALEGEIRASQLLGKKVYDSAHRRVGTLKDIVFTREAINLSGTEAVQNRANRAGANRDLTIAGITTNTTENPANALLGDRSSSSPAPAADQKQQSVKKEGLAPAQLAQFVAIIAVDAGAGPTRLFRVPFSEITLDKAQDRLMLAIKREALE